ncbi:MAG: hypothetical protein ACUVQ0_07005 [Thermoproteota archaeon]
MFSIASVAIWVVRWGWSGVAIQETTASLMAAVWLIMISMQKFER